MKKNLFMIILFFAFIFGFFFINMFIPDKKFSENENRFLAGMPKFSTDGWFDETFMKDFESYISDQFTGRENWIIAKNTIDRMTGKTEIGGVITLDNQMVEAWKEYDDPSINRNLTSINEFAMKYQNKNISFILSPTVQGVSMDELPANAGLINQEDFIKKCYDRLDAIENIDVFETLYENREDYIFYRTDHHWTSRGAYLAYVDYCENAGITPFEESDFNKELASDNFKGTLFSKTLDENVKVDDIYYYVLKNGDPDVRVEIIGKNQIHQGLYFREYLDEKDKYSSFLGSNEAIVKIRSDVADNGKSLLIIKDSYAHSMIPFLSKNYGNITMVDLRYITPGNVSQINMDDYTDVMFIYNVITFSEERGFFMLEKF